jgi:hypothetical protein
VHWPTLTLFSVPNQPRIGMRGEEHEQLLWYIGVILGSLQSVDYQIRSIPCADFVYPVVVVIELKPGCDKQPKTHRLG